MEKNTKLLRSGLIGFGAGIMIASFGPADSLLTSPWGFLIYFIATVGFMILGAHLIAKSFESISKKK